MSESNGDTPKERLILLSGMERPQADIEDIKDGAERIPEEVTRLRREGKIVTFVLDNNGYHWEYGEQQRIDLDI